MAKYNSTDWDDIRKKFKHSIMADTSLVSLAQNLDVQEWPHKGEDEKPSKYIEFDYAELLMLPEIAGNAAKADHLIGILKETLSFDDPFGDMVSQVEEKSSKENPILKTLSRLGIPEAFPLMLANFSEGTRIVCASEGVKTTGLFLPEAIGLIAAGLSRPDQLSLAKAYGAKLSNSDASAAKPLSREQMEKLENTMRLTLNAALDWFKTDKEALLKHLADGGTYERYFVNLNDPAREAIAVRLVSGVVKYVAPAAQGAEVVEKKGGFFSKLFGKR
jgi:hypothetical protein